MSGPYLLDYYNGQLALSASYWYARSNPSFSYWVVGSGGYENSRQFVVVASNALPLRVSQNSISIISGMSYYFRAALTCYGWTPASKYFTVDLEDPINPDNIYTNVMSFAYVVQSWVLYQGIFRANTTIATSVCITFNLPRAIPTYYDTQKHAISYLSLCPLVDLQSDKCEVWYEVDDAHIYTTLAGSLYVYRPEVEPYRRIKADARYISSVAALTISSLWGSINLLGFLLDLTAGNSMFSIRLTSQTKPIGEYQEPHGTWLEFGSIEGKS